MLPPSGPPHSPSPRGAEASGPAASKFGYRPASIFLAEAIRASTAAAILASLASWVASRAAAQAFQALTERSQTGMKMSFSNEKIHTIIFDHLINIRPSY